jgi:hypothetical protein
MKDIATINFTDQASGDEAFAIVRSDEVKTHVGLFLSLLEDGDIEVFMEASTCRDLIEALQQALSSAAKSD